MTKFSFCGIVLCSIVRQTSNGEASFRPLLPEYVRRSAGTALDTLLPPDYMGAYHSARFRSAFTERTPATTRTCTPAPARHALRCGSTGAARAPMYLLPCGCVSTLELISLGEGRGPQAVRGADHAIRAYPGWHAERRGTRRCKPSAGTRKPAPRTSLLFVCRQKAVMTCRSAQV